MHWNRTADAVQRNSGRVTHARGAGTPRTTTRADRAMAAGYQSHHQPGARHHGYATKPEVGPRGRRTDKAFRIDVPMRKALSIGRLTRHNGSLSRPGTACRLRSGPPSWPGCGAAESRDADWEHQESNLGSQGRLGAQPSARLHCVRRGRNGRGAAVHRHGIHRRRVAGFGAENTAARNPADRRSGRPGGRRSGSLSTIAPICSVWGLFSTN
jgi:hypothetical protein